MANCVKKQPTDAAKLLRLENQRGDIGANFIYIWWFLTGHCLGCGNATADQGMDTVTVDDVKTQILNLLYDPLSSFPTAAEVLAPLTYHNGTAMAKARWP
jgi:hypothetical protein